MDNCQEGDDVIKKIIYVHETFFREHRDMGINLLREKGYTVELWSTYKIKYNQSLSIPKDVVKDKVVYLENRLEIIKRLKRQKLKDTMVFIMTTTHRGGIEDFIRIATCLLGGRYCNFMYEMFPWGNIRNEVGKETLKQKIKDKVYSYKLLFNSFMIGHFCRPTYCFVGTFQATEKHLMAWEKKAAVSVHTKDYDDYIISTRKGKQILDKYLVYIDSDLINAEDFRKSNKSAIYPRPSVYYDSINRLFARLEEVYGLPVVIAAHPKSEYRGDEFEGRSILYYKTEELVREAKLVVTHASTAIDYVVLYRKPYLFLADHYIKKDMIWEYLFVPLVDELRISVFDLNEGDLNEVQKYINKYSKIYNAYQKKYIKEIQDNGKLFYEIVADYLNRI